MTREEIYQMLVSMGFPVAYSTFGEGQANTAPYLAYSYPESNPFYADGVVYQAIDRLRLELYTAKKDLKAEQAVEDVLTAYGLSYRKQEAYYSSEELYEIVYEMEVAIDG